MRNWGTCNAYQCDSVLPWDMSAVLVNGTPYCSPECAKNADIPDVETVGLHDPQYCAERPDEVDEKCVYFTRELAPRESPSDVIDEIAEMHGAPFRVE
jgi:hypothetical protein